MSHFFFILLINYSYIVDPPPPLVSLLCTVLPPPTAVNRLYADPPLNHGDLPHSRGSAGKQFTDKAISANLMG